jgi:hypothetical protein
MALDVVIEETRPARSEQRTPVGLSNHPATLNMATFRLAAGRRSGASSTTARATFCPSDRSRPVADGTAPGPHPPARDLVGGSTSRGPLRGPRPGPIGVPIRVSDRRCEGRLPSPGRIKCGCARRAYEEGMIADVGSIPTASKVNYVRLHRHDGRMPTYVKVICARESCGIEFEKTRGEFNKSVRQGRRHFCSLGCAAYESPAARDPFSGERLRSFRRQPDGLSPFRRHLRRARMAGRWPVTVSLSDLRDQWESQGGRCALTGIVLENPPTTGTRESDATPWRASLDRIDHGLGYELGNIRWLCVMANYCRHRFSDDDVRAFARALIEHGGDR